MGNREGPQQMFCFVVLTLELSFSENLGRLNWVRLQQAARAALPSSTSAYWVFSCVHNPPNSDTDYRILNVLTWSFVCVRIHTGVGHTVAGSAQTF